MHKKRLFLACGAAVMLGSIASSPGRAQGLPSNGAFERLVSSDRFEVREARRARALRTTEEPGKRRRFLPYVVAGVGNNASSKSLTGVIGAQWDCGQADGRCGGDDEPRNDMNLVYSSIDLDDGPVLDLYVLGASRVLASSPAGFTLTPFVSVARLKALETETGVGIAFDRALSDNVGVTFNVAGVHASPSTGDDRDDVRLGVGLSFKTTRGFSLGLEHELDDDVNGGDSTVASIKSGGVKFSVDDDGGVRASLYVPL